MALLRSDLPAELAEAFATHPAAAAAVGALPPSHQREYLDWITQAKRRETRRRRAARAVEMLLGTG